MSTLKLWVLVADGPHARILSSIPGTPWTAEADLVFCTQRKQLRQIMSDKPGRSVASLDERRSVMEYRSDPEREQERAFASQPAAVPEERRAQDDFTRLAIVAEPRMNLSRIKRLSVCAFAHLCCRDAPAGQSMSSDSRLRSQLIQTRSSASPAASAGSR